MELQQRQPTVKGPEEHFHGEVFLDAILSGGAERQVTVSSVHFAPGAHTAWHRHTVGQTLHVTEGTGFVQSRHGPLVAIRPGDTVRIAPGEEHWHGAGPYHFMTHLAITEGVTEWGQHLAPAEYPAT